MGSDLTSFVDFAITGNFNHDRWLYAQLDFPRNKRVNDELAQVARGLPPGMPERIRMRWVEQEVLEPYGGGYMNAHELEAFLARISVLENFHGPPACVGNVPGLAGLPEVMRHLPDARFIYWLTS